MERIRVPFEGEGAGAGVLTWGQHQVWQAMIEVGTSMSMGGVVPVHDARTVSDFAEELRFFMTRYPSMRTLLRIAEDGTTTQETFPSGDAFLEVHTVRFPGPQSSAPAVSPSSPDPTLAPSPDPASALSPDPAPASSVGTAPAPSQDSLPAPLLEAAGTLAAEVYAGWKARNFDYTTEWPIRMAVVQAGPGGPVIHVVVMVCHIAADGSGLATMVRELAQRDAIGPHAATSHLDLVALQQASTRQTDNAMRYWETQLRAIAPQRFPAGFNEPPAPRFRQLVWQSPALHAAGERLAALLSIDSAPILLAAYGVAFTRVVGDGPFATQVIVSNRFRPGLADVVSPLAQNGLVVFEARDTTAAEAVSRARQSSMSASKYAYYDPATRQALIDQIGKDRGEPLDLQVFYNERRMTLRPPASTPDEAAIRSLLPATTLIRETPLPYFNEKLMINIDDVPDTIQITTEIDTAYLPIEGLHRLLQEMENFTVAAALNLAAQSVP
ncbi:condensation domain-containing protein [Dactylosporangium sp. CA-233914]|uniref:condensation domain-containing protein n=1 Tax=Dactylosporangium sp. CA-233914 TaxID=3239934 RepID=UPI003D923852